MQKLEGRWQKFYAPGNVEAGVLIHVQKVDSATLAQHQTDLYNLAIKVLSQWRTNTQFRYYLLVESERGTSAPCS
jgi:hypothetical protein